MKVKYRKINHNKIMHLKILTNWSKISSVNPCGLQVDD
ncbi:hypothetical protein ECDEC9A_3196 [Escherichia coli DEC9A]|nr:hypothetical protein ECDEC9A_3196 [Escherichia coli DEC9A]